MRTHREGTRADRPENNSRIGKTHGKEPGADGLSSLFRGPNATRRVQSVRRALDRALDRWWQHGHLPSRGLLRDALLVLQAGHTLNDPARTLVLRAALFHGKGMLTALRHQTDPERTASVICDMLLQPRRPLSPAQIGHLVREDADSTAWRAPLLQLLREESDRSLAPRRTLAIAALHYLEDKTAHRTDHWTPISKDVPSGPSRPPAHRTRTRARSPLLGILALVLLATSLALFWQAGRSSETPMQAMQTIPAGVYVVASPSDPQQDQEVQIRAFAIDRTEVTNQAFRACLAAGACTQPAQATSAARPDYFLAPNWDAYPVVNVTWSQAATFCRWQNKRLPLAEEWEIAAGSALTLRRRYLLPWGDTFRIERANSAGSPAEDTQPVGAYSPAGDSPAGAADMAGNVAEWTATAASGAPTRYVVKGGSFLSRPPELTIASQQTVKGDNYAPWLGFRCAVTLPDG